MCITANLLVFQLLGIIAGILATAESDTWGLLIFPCLFLRVDCIPYIEVSKFNIFSRRVQRSYFPGRKGHLAQASDYGGKDREIMYVRCVWAEYRKVELNQKDAQFLHDYW